MTIQQRQFKWILVELMILALVWGLGASLNEVSAQSCQAGEQRHVVVSGENLYRIGLRYGVSYSAIASRNGISDVTRIYAGDVLCIAGGSAPSAPSAPVTTIATTPVPSTTTQTTTVNVRRGEENWCLNGGPWDDGRCIHPNNPDLQEYWFISGWCNAQISLGNYGGNVEDCIKGAQFAVTASVTSNRSLNYSLVTLGDAEFACSIVFDKDAGVLMAMARWTETYSDQEQVIFYTNLPNASNQAVFIGEDDLRAGVIIVTDPYKTFNSASARLKTREDSESPDENGAIADCERIEV